MQTETEIRTGAPLYLFTIGEKNYEVPVLSMNGTDRWLERVREVEALEQEIGATDGNDETTAAIQRYNAAVLDCVCSYSDVLDVPEVREGITANQIAYAYRDLKETSNPFERIQRLSLEEVKQKLDFLPVAAQKLAIEKVLDKRLTIQKQEPSSS